MHQPAQRLGRDFWTFWLGQTVSNFGSSITQFAIPLLTFRLTGSALNLALTTVSTFLPYLLFGLLIGAWVDRLERKRLMIVIDVLQALTLCMIPLAAMLGMLNVLWLYAIAFISSTLTIGFQAAEFAAIPSLVGQDNLVTANGRIQASFSAATVMGPLVAGLLLAVISLPNLLLFDSASFLFSACSLYFIRMRFNSETQQQHADLRTAVVEGLRYVFQHPVLRAISIMMVIVNAIGATVFAQLILFAQRRLAANDTQIGLLYAAGSVGVILISLLAGYFRKRWSFGTVALGSLMICGILNIILAFTTSFWVAAILWALFNGFGILFNINTSSLRQSIVPNKLLGRVITIASVIGTGAVPLGAFIGGYAIEKTGNIVLVFAIIGIATTIIPALFAFTALGRAEQYIAREASSEAV